MPIRIRCGHCGVKLEAADSAAGKTLACPKCRQPVKIPEHAAVEAPAVPQAAAEEQERPEASPEPAADDAGDAGEPAEAVGGGEAGVAAQPADAGEEGRTGQATEAVEGAAAEGQEEAAFYGGEPRRSGVIRWALVLVLFAAATAFCVWILTKSKEDVGGAVGLAANIDEEFVAEIRKLTMKADEEALAGNKEEAIKLYEEVIGRLEKLPPEKANIHFGLKRIRMELEALKTGKTVQQVEAESKAAQAEKEPEPEPDRPGEE